MIDIIRLAELVPGDHGPTVVALALPDRTVHAPSAITSETTHAPPSCCASARGRAAVEGPVELAGPGDPLNGGGAERLRLRLREIYTAAGGTHDDYAAYGQGDGSRTADGGPGHLRRVYHS